jgi:hypothetical protein
MKTPRLGDFGDSAADRGLIDRKICFRCEHGRITIEGIDCAKRPWDMETTDQQKIRAWLWGKLGAVECPVFTEA